MGYKFNTYIQERTYTFKVPSHDKLSGPVFIRPPILASTFEKLQTFAYVNGCSEALAVGYQSTLGPLRVAANRAVDIEKGRACSVGNPYKWDCGHVPDTAWTGKAVPYKWMDLMPSVNRSIGG